MAYDRRFKETALDEVLRGYSRFLRIADNPTHARFAFLLTMCRMIDNTNSAAENREPIHCVAEPIVEREPQQPSMETHDCNAWQLDMLRDNEAAFFAAFKYDSRVDEAANRRAFLERLLDPPEDTVFAPV